MTHDHTHKLNFACMDCVKARVRERDRLLHFTKTIAGYLKHKNDIDYNLELVAVEAYQLLKELGFEVN